MTALEFDAWLATVPDGVYHTTSFEALTASDELNALRAWAAHAAEARRLEVVIKLERSEGGSSMSGYVRSTEQQLAEARSETDRLAALLNSAGWSLPQQQNESRYGT